MRRELSADNRGHVIDGTSDERAPAWGKLAQNIHMGNGIYWCSHCTSWRLFENGAADEGERTYGPICDECWTVFVKSGRING